MEISSFRQCQNGEWIQNPTDQFITAPPALAKCPNRYRCLANLDKHDAWSLIEFSFYLTMDDFFINTLSKIADIFLQTRK